MKKIRQRLLSLVMAAVMIVSLLPATALASDGDRNPTAAELAAIGYSFVPNGYTIKVGPETKLNFNLGLKSAQTLSGEGDKPVSQFVSKNGKSCLFFTVNTTVGAFALAQGEGDNPYFGYCDARAKWDTNSLTIIIPQSVEDLCIDSAGRIYLDYQDHNNNVKKYYLGEDGFTPNADEAAVSTVNFTVTAGNGGSVSVNGTGVTNNGTTYTVKKGTSVTLNATPNSDYNFKNWSDGNTSASRQVTIQGSENFVANFEKKTVTFTVAAGTGGRVSVEGATSAGGNSYTAEIGASVKLTAIPDTNYRFNGWVGGGGTNPMTISAADGASYTATFTRDQVSVNLGNPQNVTVTSGQLSQSLSKGDSYSVTLKANDGYALPSQSAFDTALAGTGLTAQVSGDTVTISGKPSMDVNVTLPDAVDNTWDVKLTLGSNMTSTSSLKQTVTKGQAISDIVLTPAAGYKLPEVSAINIALDDNGLTVTKNSDGTITISGAPTKNVTAYLPNAVYNRYDIQITNPTGSHITATGGSLTQSITKGQPITDIVLTPERGYALPGTDGTAWKTLTDAGLQVEKNPTTGAVTIKGTPNKDVKNFTLPTVLDNTWEVNMTPGANSHISIAPEDKAKQSVVRGEDMTPVTLTPEKGYELPGADDNAWKALKDAGLSVTAGSNGTIVIDGTPEQDIDLPNITATAKKHTVTHPSNTVLTPSHTDAATEIADYTVKYTAVGDHLLPTDVSAFTVTVGDVALTAGTDFTYNQDGTLTVKKEKITGEVKISVDESKCTPVAKWEGEDKTELYPDYPFTMPTSGKVTIITPPTEPKVVTVPAGVQLVGKGEGGGTVTGTGEGTEAIITTDGKVIEIKHPTTDPTITGKVTNPETGKVTITVSPVDPGFKYVVTDEDGNIVDIDEDNDTDNEWKTPGQGEDELTFGPLDPGTNYQVVAVPTETPTDGITKPTEDKLVGPQITEYPFVTPVTPTVKPSDTIIKPEGGEDYLVVPGEETKTDRDYALAVRDPDGNITLVNPDGEDFGWKTGTGTEDNDLKFGPLEELGEGEEYVIVESGKYTGTEDPQRDPHIFDPDTVDEGWKIEAPDPAEVTGRTAQSITVKPKADEAYQVGEGDFYRVVEKDGKKSIQKQGEDGSWDPYEGENVTLTSSGNLTFKGLEKDKKYEIFNKRLEEDEDGKLIESPMTETTDSTSQVSADEIAKAFDKDVVEADGEDDVIEGESDVINVTVDPDGNYVVTLEKDVTAAETGAGAGQPTVTIPDTWGEVTIDQGKFDIKGQDGTETNPSGTQGIAFTQSTEAEGKGTDLTITATDGEIIGGDGYTGGENGGEGGAGIGVTGTGDPNDIRLTITDGKVTGGEGGEGTATGGEGGDGITGPFVVETEETVVTGGNGGKGGQTGGEGGDGIKTTTTTCPDGIENPIKVTGGSVTGGNGGEGGTGGKGGGGITTEPSGPDKPILVTGGGSVTGGNGGKGGTGTGTSNGGAGGEGGDGITGPTSGKVEIDGGSVTGGEGGNGGAATGTGNGGAGGEGGGAITSPGSSGQITITGPGGATGGNGGEGGSSAGGNGGEGGSGGSVCPEGSNPTITTEPGGVDLVGGNGGNGGNGKNEGGAGGEGGKIPTCPAMKPGMIVTGGSGGSGGSGTKPGEDGKAESVTLTSTSSSITATGDGIDAGKKYVAVDKDGKVYGPVTATADGKVTIPGLSADTWYQIAEADETGDKVQPGTPVGAITTGKFTGGGIITYPKPIITTEGGKVTVNPQSPAPGNKVFITATPDEGKMLGEIIVVTQSGKELIVTDEGNSVYSYTQPSGSELPVEIIVTFISDPKASGVADLLIVDDHIAYMKGDDNGSFRPDANITRAEAAQMFYNLLKDKNVTGDAAFSDVAADAWYAEAVLALSNLGILYGVSSDTFAPDKAITRAEFVAMAVRFANGNSGEAEYSDVAPGYWAYELIGQASYYGWINGYVDGTFRPMNNITRGEAAKVVNTMLARRADMEYVKAHAGELRFFPDVAETYWAYGVILEATNTHDFTRTNGKEHWGK